MRFVCDSCRAQYMISDEKVGPKGVKVRCKKCGFVILVRRADGAAPADAAAAPAESHESASGLSAEGPPVEAPPAHDGAPANGAAQNSVFGGVEDDEIGAVFDQVLKSGPHKLEEKPAINPLTAPPENEDLSLGLDGEDLASTRVVSTDALKRLAEAAEAQASGLDQADTRKVPVPNDWFVAVDDQQVGPLTLEKVKDMWDRGEIGPDSLCWRAGMADWMPLSEVKELASELAPKPQKPVIGAQATTAVVHTPVDSPFAGGGVGTSMRAEVALFPSGGGASAPAADTGGWKPSAASALASLVSEEMSALSKKPAQKSLLESGPRDIPAGLAGIPAPSAPAARGLLDLPSEPSRSTPHAGAPVLTPSGSAAMAQTPGAPYAGPPMFGAPAGYPAYGAPPVVAKQGMSKGLKVGLGVGGLALAAAAGVIVFLLIRPVATPPPAVETPVAAAPAAAPKTELPMPPPPAGTTPTAAGATAATANGAAPATATPPPPTTEGATAAKPEPTAVAAKPEPTAVAAKPEPVATRTEPARTGTTTAKRTTTARTQDDDGDAIVATSRRTAAEETAPSGGGDDDFDALFGEKKKPAETTVAKKKSQGYIPPAPGASDVPERLGQSDIMAVVLENKAAIRACVDEQKAKQPDLSGTLVVRWTIQTSGRTSGVSVQSDEFRSTPMASCIVGLVKKMQFPRHRVQGDPINFPFKF